MSGLRDAAHACESRHQWPIGSSRCALSEEPRPRAGPRPDRGRRCGSYPRNAALDAVRYPSGSSRSDQRSSVSRRWTEVESGLPQLMSRLRSRPTVRVAPLQVLTVGQSHNVILRRDLGRLGRLLGGVEERVPALVASCSPHADSVALPVGGEVPSVHRASRLAPTARKWQPLVSDWWSPCASQAAHRVRPKVRASSSRPVLIPSSWVDELRRPLDVGADEQGPSRLVQP
jgi:hypothetical protein